MSSTSRVRLLLGAFLLILVAIAVISQLPNLYRRMISETLPVGRFPLGGIRQTGAGGDLSDGWATGHDDDHRGWLVSWSHVPGMPASDEMSEVTRRGLDALASTDAGDARTDEHSGRQATDGDHRVAVERMKLQGERTLEAVQLTWGCPHGQRGLSVILWAPTSDELPVEPEELVNGMACHADGQLSPAPPLPIVDLPSDYRKESDALQGSLYTTLRSKEKVLVRGGFRWHQEKYPTLPLMAGEDYWYRFLEAGLPKGRNVSLPDVPHPVWELSTNMSGRLYLAYLWYCPFHDKVLSVAWWSPYRKGGLDLDGPVPDFLRRIQCAEGCKG